MIRNSSTVNSSTGFLRSRWQVATRDESNVGWPQTSCSSSSRVLPAIEASRRAERSSSAGRRTRTTLDTKRNDKFSHSQLTRHGEELPAVARSTDHHSPTLTQRPKIDDGPIQPLIRPRLFPIWYLVLDRLYEVQVIAAPYFAQHDFAKRQSSGINGRNGTQLARLNLASHRIAARPERDGLSGLEFRDVASGPSHVRDSCNRELLQAKRATRLS